jgi:hypothetical protein
MHLARTSTALAGLAAIALLAAGCGDDSGSGGGGNDVETLSQEQVEQALLTIDNLGPGFVVAEEDDDEEDEDDSGLGCLFSDIEESPLDKLAEDDNVEAEVEYEFQAEIPSPGVQHSISSSPEVDPDDEDVLQPIVDAIDGCTEVDETDDEGNVLDLAVSYDTEISDEKADEQVNLFAEGTMTTPDGVEVPISFRFAFTRLDNNLSMLGVFTVFDDNGGPLFDAYQQIAVDRLAAVIDGEEPEATTAPAPA